MLWGCDIRMECNSCEKECVMKGKYKGVYPCMVFEHVGTPELNEHCIRCIQTQQACCFKEKTSPDNGLHE